MLLPVNGGQFENLAGKEKYRFCVICELKKGYKLA
jgi:hypothetical protein